MNLFGFLLLLFSITALLYPCYSLYLRHRSRPDVTPFLPYISSIPVEFLNANWIKGYQFEKYIVSKFDRNYFCLFFWNGDKRADGIYPVTSSNPDLEYDYRDAGSIISFAVECKWRSQFVNNQVQWAEHDQIEQYKRYERSSGRIVFVVLGVGGEPNDPQEMFTVPLSKIPRHMDMLTAEFLAPYKRQNLQANFFLNKQAMRLQ